MDHPNAIYFIVGAYAWLAFQGLLFLLGAFGIGPFGEVESPKFMNSKAMKASFGVLSLLFGIYAVVWQTYLRLAA